MEEIDDKTPKMEYTESIVKPDYSTEFVRWRAELITIEREIYVDDNSFYSFRSSDG